MPPKFKAKKPQGPRYLFVNEDATTVLRTSKDVELDRSKQSHVQRHNLARKKRAKATSSSSVSTSVTQDADPPSFKIISPQSEHHTSSQPIQEADLSDLSIYEDNFTTFLTRTLTPLHYSDSQNPDQTVPSGDISWSLEDFLDNPSISQIPFFENMVSDPSLTDTNELYPESNTIQPFTRSHSLNTPSRLILDPFKNTETALEQWAPPLIQYYTTVIIPSMFQIESRTVPLHAMRHAPALHADMQACMSEAAHMYALLAATSSRMLSEEGLLLLPDVTKENFTRVPLFFKTKAITALQQKLLTGNLDQPVVVDVYRLTAASLFLNDSEATEAHLQAQHQMISALGGLDTFDDYTKERMILLDIYGAAKGLNAPIFELTWDPGRLAEQAPEKMSLSSSESLRPSGTRLLSISISTFFHQDLIDVIEDLRQVVRMAFDPATQAKYTQYDLSWMTLRTAAIDHRLLSFRRFEKGDKNLKQECTRIALIFWIGLTLGDPARKKAAAGTAHILKERLENSELIYQWRPQTDLLLWIATIGILTEQNNAERSWFADLASSSAQELEISTLREYEEVLEGFFYSPGLQYESVATAFSHFGYVFASPCKDPQSQSILQPASESKSKEIE